MMADGRVVETQNLKKVLDAKLKIKKEKEGQYEEKIMQVCVEEFDLNQEEVLTSLKKAVDDRMLKIVNKNNKNSYRIVQETHLDEDYVVDSHIGETTESTDVVKDLSIRLEKNFPRQSYKLEFSLNSVNESANESANEFRLLKVEMQQQLTRLRENFIERQKSTHLPKSTRNLDSSLLSNGSEEHTIQNGMLNKNYDIDKNLNFVINLLKGRISLFERQSIEKTQSSIFA